MVVAIRYLALFAMLVSACSSSEFTGDNTKAKKPRPRREVSSGDVMSSSDAMSEAPPGANAIKFPGANSADFDAAFGVDPKRDLGFEFDPGDRVVKDGEKVKRPLSVIFVIDVTSSMQFVIDAIKSSVIDFANRLRANEFDPTLGVVAFRDAVTATLPLTKDMASFQQFVNGQSASGGGDGNEAALSGVQTALQKAASESDPDALKAILVVTDNPGHLGGSGGGLFGTRRDCKIDSLVTTLNGLSTKEQNLVKIYHSTGTNSLFGVNAQAACGGYQTAEQQWNDLLSKAPANSAPDKRGGKLPYPFSGTVLVDDFVELIVKTTPPVNQVCLAHKATLKQSGRVLASWQKNVADIYGIWMQGKAIYWPNALPKSEIPSFVKASASLEVTRCCVAIDQADTGNFSSCRGEVQTLNFKTRL